MEKEIILAGGMRTPFGDYGKSLKDIIGTDLATHAASACLDDLNLSPSEVDHLVLGNVLPVDQGGYFASRVVALECGLPTESRALNVSRACGSGSQAIISATEQIMTGHSKIALAGGYENFSRAPYVSTDTRWGGMRGPVQMIDTLDYAYRDPFDLQLMGDTAENLADDFSYNREDMDAWALMSQQRAAAAIESGFLAKQIAPIEVPERKGTRLFAVDEYPRQTSLEKLGSLKPVFRGQGKVTAGNASGVTDGAAFVLVADRQAAEAAGIKPRARIVDWSVVGVEPRIMGCGPVPAIADLLKRNDLKAGDIDYYEINEAFAAVNLHAEAQLGIPREITNLYGGGISIGHPPGATGVRMTITAMQHLDETEGRYAIISMCLGGGQGMATLIERVS
ncbi:MAG: acetyl-CoA C-acyltransferase [Candidatus Reddybacter sp.]